MKPPGRPSVQITEKATDLCAKAIRVHFGRQESEDHFVFTAVTDDAHGGHDIGKRTRSGGRRFETGWAA
jgi:hypothetical protein